MTGTEINILLVEDNPDDAALTREAFIGAKLRNKMETVTDGVEAMRFLRREGKYADKTAPDLVLLDLNLPKKDGREVLEEIKTDEKLKHIPVVILTTSESETDVLKSYKLHANCFITKPVDFNRFIEVVKTIEEFWFTVVKLPSK